MKIKIFSILTACIGIPGYAIHALNSSNSASYLSQKSRYSFDSVFNKNLGVDEKKNQKYNNLTSLATNKTLNNETKEEVQTQFSIASGDENNNLISYFSSADFIKRIKKLSNLKSQEKEKIIKAVEEFDITFPAEGEKNLKILGVNIKKKKAGHELNSFFNDKVAQSKWTLSESEKITKSFKEIHDILVSNKEKYNKLKTNDNTNSFEINYMDEEKSKLFQECLTELETLFNETIGLKKTPNYDVISKNDGQFSQWVETIFRKQLVQKWKKINYIDQCLNGENNQEYKTKFQEIITAVQQEIQKEVKKEEKKIEDARKAEEARLQAEADAKAAEEARIKAEADAKAAEEERVAKEKAEEARLKAEADEKKRLADEKEVRLAEEKAEADAKAKKKADEEAKNSQTPTALPLPPEKAPNKPVDGSSLPKDVVIDFFGHNEKTKIVASTILGLESPTGVAEIKEKVELYRLIVKVFAPSRS